MIKSIFPGKNQGLVELFESAGRPSKVGCVVFDYAKRTHTALICDGAGRRLKGAFPVPNSPEGIDTVLERVEKICRKHQIERRHVFCGGESCGSYAVNFVHGVEQRGFLVVSVNPAEAKKQRENLQASTDKVDLLGIAKLLLDQRGSTRSTEVLSKVVDRKRRSVSFPSQEKNTPWARGERIHSECMLRRIVRKIKRLGWKETHWRDCFARERGVSLSKPLPTRWMSTLPAMPMRKTEKGIEWW